MPIIAAHTGALEVRVATTAGGGTLGYATGGSESGSAPSTQGPAG